MRRRVASLDLAIVGGMSGGGVGRVVALGMEEESSCKISCRSREKNPGSMTVPPVRRSEEASGFRRSMGS